MAEQSTGGGGSGDWRDQLLLRLRAPSNNLTRTALALWAQSEGVKSSANNWLATTLDVPGAGTYNGVGVRVYPTVAVGVEATAKTLLVSAYGYPAIVRALRQGTDALAIWVAINASSWCKSCQGGSYPIAMRDWAHGHPVAGATRKPAPHVTQQVHQRSWDASPAFKSLGERAKAHGTGVQKASSAMRQSFARHSKIR